MHSAAMARAGHHNRPLTSEETRRAIRAQGAAAAATLPAPGPSCAFGASAGAIIVDRGFSITYPFTGAVAAFAAGHVVDLWSAREWAPCERIVIVVERATIGDGYRLLALPSDVATRGDTVLGGFDLDPSGAVLADSFWDADLTDAAGPGQGNERTRRVDPHDARPIVTRMAEACITLNAEHPAGCTRQTLHELGFTQDEIDANFAAASIRANSQFVRQVADDRVDPEAPDMVAARMRVAIGELIPGRQFIVTDLMARGFTRLQIDVHLRGAIADAARDFSGITLPPSLRRAG